MSSLAEWLQFAKKKRNREYGGYRFRNKFEKLKKVASPQLAGIN